MGLIDLQTDLKSLKFGKDRFGGGDSGQPFIKNPIIDEPGKLAHGDNDILIRGGLKAPIRAAEDVARLTKYLFNTKSPNGLLFVAKQNILSRTSVKTESSRGIGYGGGVINQGIYTPLSTLAQAGVNFAGAHLNTFGIDPTSPMTGVLENGLFPGLGLNRYEDIVKSKSTQDNRLVGIYTAIDQKTSISNFDFQKGLDINVGNSIIRYSGGPNSVLGIGKTSINFADQRTGVNNPLASNNEDYFYKGGVRLHDYVQTPENKNQLGVSNKKSSRYTKEFIGLTDEEIGINDQGKILIYPSPRYKPKNPEIGEDFRDLKNPLQNKTFLSISPGYKTNNIEQRVHLGNPGAKGDISDYTKGKNKVYEALDKITASPIYTSTGDGDSSGDKNDLVKFRIGFLGLKGTNLYINFRAFIDKFSESYKADWKKQKYMGRAEEFYKYDGFGRDISLDFTVAAQSKPELMEMYKKLNFLASTLAPTYTGEGYMAGNLAKLTLGGYLYEQPGIIESLSYDIPDESPWEIGIDNTDKVNDDSVKELPMMIKVSMKFTPIHNFRPEMQKNTFSKGNITSYGDQRYIALSKGNGESNNNYDSPNTPSKTTSTSTPQPENSTSGAIEE